MEEWTVRGIVAQIFGLLGMAMNIASYQARERRRVILIQLFGSTFFAVNMLMLGAYSGFLLNAIGIARALVYARPAVMKRARGVERGVHRALCAFLRGSVYRVQEAADGHEPDPRAAAHAGHDRLDARLCALGGGDQALRVCQLALLADL